MADSAAVEPGPSSAVSTVPKPGPPPNMSPDTLKTQHKTAKKPEKVKEKLPAKAPPKKKKPLEPKSEAESHNEKRIDMRQCRLGLIIGHQIGSGSFAKVYKAYSCQKQKDVAVKIFKRSDIPENYFNKFIVREIEVIKELRHRNLVKFYDCQFTTKR